MEVGDFQEVMYFATKTPQERQEWMEAFRQGIITIINNSLRAAIMAYYIPPLISLEPN